MDQRTDEWFKARLGKVTASRVADVVAKTKSGYSASRANYLADLVVERLTGQPASTFTNAHMERGIEQEPFARDAYSARTGELVEQCGFIEHPNINGAGASPDGLMAEGLVEIKCPTSATHLDLWLTESIPSKYRLQMQWQMACTGAKWCDFVSFDNRMPAHLQLFIRRVDRDDALIAELESEVKAFLTELNDKVSKLKELPL